MGARQALRDALEATDAWDFSEVDDDLELDIAIELQKRGYLIRPIIALLDMDALREAVADVAKANSLFDWASAEELAEAYADALAGLTTAETP